MAVRALVASAFGVSAGTLAARTRGRNDEARARQVAMYLCHVALGATLSDIGRRFGRDRTTVAHACAAVEDSRDRPGFDGAVAALEWAVAAWCRCFLDEGPPERPASAPRNTPEREARSSREAAA